METYDVKKIKKVYYTIAILDSCNDVYDEITEKHVPQNLIDACKFVIEQIKHDKELGDDFGIWSYLVVKHEEDDNTDWQSFYKVYKYRNQWRYKQVNY